jgi:arsenate reductase
MAEGFARHLGSQVINPASAGLARANTIARETQEVMLEKGIDLSEQFPKDFEPIIASSYDIVVNISGFLLPPFQGPELLEWEVQDPYGEALSVHRRVRDEIERRVKRMIVDLQHGETGAEHPPDGQRIASMNERKPRLWQRFTKWR